MATRTTRRRTTRKSEPFKFEFQGRPYVINADYNAKPTTIFTTDGLRLEVRIWELSFPIQPVPDKVDTFTPVSAEELAKLASLAGGFVAELVEVQQQASTATSSDVLGDLDDHPF